MTRGKLPSTGYSACCWGSAGGSVRPIYRDVTTDKRLSPKQDTPPRPLFALREGFGGNGSRIGKRG